ncbi:MAG: hypothetical protein Q4B70_17375 [Lachnospiraceae bacterium]|nr:hypothetical protein [Lachnospiraceae bacterium]
MIDHIWYKVKSIANQNYSGIDGNMRYFLYVKDDILYANAFPMPYKFSCTPKDKIVTKEFPAKNEELPKITDWLNEQSQKEWEPVSIAEYKEFNGVGR